ncbi:hypothetical protein KUTeg_003073 [Tegillarca granosa]|uniref:Heparan-alpha-glucosaminide N-acetyltransferase n=1 Tax=Tegillarca granosa TaxID=220873 RepID=A0ABQ9FPX3_TEGGR|nr:hypothetical protein KUTeg_003073 [Tegillarca granosa]
MFYSRFVFIMGTAMAYSFNTQIRRCVPKHLMFFKIFKRSCILFLLGLVINTGGGSAVELEKLRIMGVLQRFALTYFIIATMHMFFAKTADVHMHAYWNKFRDILYYWPEWIINFAILAVFLSLTFGLDVPGCGKGYIGPGGLHDHSQYFNCTGGAAGYIDRKIFGDKHIYQSPTSKQIYNSTVPYDPEGLLGTLTSCLICFLGLQAGKILMIFKSRNGRVVRFLVWGFILCLIAGILCKFSQNDGWIPINKNLWSLSFVLCLSGMGFILLAFCYLTIDEWKVWNGAPFYYPGNVT